MRHAPPQVEHFEAQRQAEARKTRLLYDSVKAKGESLVRRTGMGEFPALDYAPMHIRLVAYLGSSRTISFFQQPALSCRVTMTVRRIVPEETAIIVTGDKMTGLGILL